MFKRITSDRFIFGLNCAEELHTSILNRFYPVNGEEIVYRFVDECPEEWRGYPGNEKYLGWAMCGNQDDGYILWNLFATITPGSVLNTKSEATKYALYIRLTDDLAKDSPSYHPTNLLPTSKFRKLLGYPD